MLLLIGGASRLAGGGDSTLSKLTAGLQIVIVMSCNVLFLKNRRQYYQTLPNLEGLVLGCIEADLCK